MIAEADIYMRMPKPTLFHEAGQVPLHVVPQVQEVGQQNDPPRPVFGMKVDPLGDRGRVNLKKGRAEAQGGPSHLKAPDDLVHRLVRLSGAAPVAEEDDGRVPGVFLRFV